MQFDFPGIHRIELPLPFELASVNVFLIRLKSGYMLIDCGMDTDASFPALEAGLRAAAIEWTDIRQILLTHMHPDHMGLSAKLKQLTGAPIIMHSIEEQQLRAVITPERRAQWIDRAFNESGVPLPLQSKMHEHFQIIRKNFHPLTPDGRLQGGEEIETAIGPLQILWTPGHSPGHVVLYSRQHRMLLSGDQILPDITPNIAWLPQRDTLADFLQSLESLKALDVDLIIPSHGRPFQGHRAWIEETIQHHHERCREIMSLLTEPRTAYSLVGDLWRKKLSPINRQFALLEVLSHLEFLHRRGQVSKEQWDGAVRWLAT